MSKRIDTLDSFRAISIISVILFHFFSRWTQPTYTANLYPYGNEYDYFRFGYHGVHFFFIISGFVIYFTLVKTERFFSFWRKRMIRLFPSMLFASLITFWVFTTLDKNYLFPSSHEAKNFIPSLSFISPELFKNFHFDVAFLNGSYWSLWTEIQFYLLVSVLYYASKRRFLNIFLAVSTVLILTNQFFLGVLTTNKLQLQLPAGVLDFYATWIFHGFDLARYLPYFVLGVLFYELFQAQKTGSPIKKSVIATGVFVVLYIFYTNRISYVSCLVMLVALLLFLAFIYRPDSLSFLDRKPIVETGRSSYFLYLIHENIGVLFISLWGTSVFPVSFLFPLFLIFVLVVASVLFTRYIDMPVSGWLGKKVYLKGAVKSLLVPLWPFPFAGRQRTLKEEPAPTQVSNM